MTKIILPLDFFLLGGAFTPFCEDEEQTVASGMSACQLTEPDSPEYLADERLQPVEQSEEFFKMSPLSSF